MRNRFASFDLNLLPVLKTLLTQCNVTKSAAILGLSQPAVSNALQRLRIHFDDLLLVRSGRAMKRTTYAERLVPHLDSLIDQISEFLATRIHFEPLTSDRHFVLCMGDHLAMTVGPEILRRLQGSAPNTTLKVVSPSLDIRERLEGGEVDALFIGPSENLTGALCSQAVMEDRLVIVMAQSHRLASVVSLSFGELARERRVGIDFSRSGETNFCRVRQLLSAANGGMAVSASQMTAVPGIVAASGDVAIIPDSFAKEVEVSLNLKIIDLDGIDSSFPLLQYWSNSADSDPGGNFIRQVCENAFGAVYPGYMATHK